jgi:MFS transporter, DHA1 family, staphyloferrin B biosynthesis exporter
MEITTFDIIWRQQIRYVIFGQFIIICMLDMSDPYWPLILSSSHSFDSKTLQYWSGVIYMAPLLTTIITTFLWIKLGERIGYKKMILRAGFALAATQWSLFFFSNPWFILLIRLMQGALAGFSTAAQAWSLAITPINTHSQVIGRLQAATALGSIIGPICGGFISHYFSYLAIFITAGCVCLLISIALANYLQENTNVQPITSEKKIQKTFFLEPQKNLLLFLIGSAQAARWMSTPFFALYAAERLHASTLALGLIYALIAFAMSLTTPSLGWIVDRRSPRFTFTKYVLAGSFLLSGAIQWGYAYTAEIYFAFILSLFLGVCLGVTALLLFSFLLQDAEENRGKLIGLGNTALKFGNLIGIIIGTVIQAQYNFLISFLFIGFFYFVLAVLTMRYKPEIVV